MAAVALAGMVTAATAVVVLRHEPAQAYSLDAATLQAEHVNTLSYELETSTTDGTTTFAEIDMDIDRGLTKMTMDDGSDERWEYIFDVDHNRVYAGADQFAAIGFDVGDAGWVSIDLDELLDENDMSAVYGQAGENPLDATLLFDVADGIDDLGFDEVRGERVRHYEVTIDEDVVIASSHTTSGFVNDGEVDPEGKDIYDVYVNESNMIVRLSYDFEVMDQWASVDLTVTGTDEHVDIVVPKRSDVIAFDDISFFDD